MDFVLVDVGQELVEQTVGPLEFHDVISGQQWRQSFLPEVVRAFDLALGLGRGRVTQGDSVEVKRFTQ
jgi:hypothetical protein